jgi:hypothetical protein
LLKGIPEIKNEVDEYCKYDKQDQYDGDKLGRSVGWQILLVIGKNEDKYRRNDN